MTKNSSKKRHPQLSRDEERGYRAGFKAGTEAGHHLQKSLTKALQIQRMARLETALKNIVTALKDVARVRKNTFIETAILAEAKEGLKK